MGKWDQIKTSFYYWYFQWELYSQLYVLDREEKPWFYLILFAVVALFLYGAVNYLPPYFTAMANPSIFWTEPEVTHNEM